MITSYSPHPILIYFRNNWFKISLIALVIFACVRKNLIFDVRLKGNSEQGTPSGSLSSGNEKETLTLHENQSGELSEGSFRIPLLGGRSATQQSSELAIISDSVKIQYLKRFAKVAVGEQKKFRIPASIILAAALTQSFAGKRDVAISGNNHFALQCTKDWQGARGIHEGECYRVYDNAWSSFRDNSLFILSLEGSEITSLKGKDYKTWANSLESAGYSSNKGFATDLVSLIEHYQLNQLDQM